MLVHQRRVAAFTQSGVDLPWLDGVQRPRTPKRIPSFLTVAEVSALSPDTALLTRFLYGTGMRLMDGMRLRIKDVDFGRSVIVVRQAKGDKDRVVIQIVEDERSASSRARPHALAGACANASAASIILRRCGCTPTARSGR